MTGLLALVLAATALCADQAPDKLGSAIHAQGIGRDGRELVGRLGGDLRMRGAAVACANCHGRDARGGGEAFVRAPDIRWYTLSKPYGAARADGAVRPGYDRASFVRALRSGVGSDGIALDPAMPRFDLADDEIASLIAYLDQTREAPPPPALVLLLPETADPLAEALRVGLQTCPQPPRKPADGQTLRRLPALRVHRYREPLSTIPLVLPAETAALIAPYAVGREQALADALGANAPQVLFPITLFEPIWHGAARYALPGLEAQSLVLLDSVDALRRASAKPVLLVHADSHHADAAALASRVSSAAAVRGWRVQAWAGRADDWVSDAVAILTLAPLPLPPDTFDSTQQRSAPLAVLVPSALSATAAARAWSEVGAGLRIALPYPPAPGEVGRWVAPAQAWTAIGCELLTRLPPLPNRIEELADWRAQVEAMPVLSLSPWLELPAVETSEQAARRVVLIDWSP